MLHRHIKALVIYFTVNETISGVNESNVTTSVLKACYACLDWPRLSYREQFKEGDEEVGRGNDGKTTSKSGLALNGIYYYRKLRSSRSGGSWL